MSMRVRSEPADENHHIQNTHLECPFVCAAGTWERPCAASEKVRAMIRTKGEAEPAMWVEAVRHARTVLGDIRTLQNKPDEELMVFRQESGAPFELVKQTQDAGPPAVVNFPPEASRRRQTPRDDAAGVDGVFVGRGIQKQRTRPTRQGHCEARPLPDPGILAE